MQFSFSTDIILGAFKITFNDQTQAGGVADSE